MGLPLFLVPHVQFDWIAIGYPVTESQQVILTCFWFVTSHSESLAEVYCYQEDLRTASRRMGSIS